MSVRQEIIDEVEFYLSCIPGITMSSIFPWKTTELQIDDLPAIIYRDAECTRMTGEGVILGKYTWCLKLQIEAYATGSSERSCSEALRTLVDHVIGEIGEGSTGNWNDKATFTEIGETITFTIERKEHVVGMATFELAIYYVAGLFGT